MQFSLVPDEKFKVHLVLGQTRRSTPNDLEQDRLDGGYSSSSRDTSVDLECDYRQVKLHFDFLEILLHNYTDVD